MNWFRNDEGFLKRFVKGVLIVLISIPLVITIVRYSAWKMAAFLFFWVLCPGILVDRYILKQKQEDFLMSVLTGFFMGMALIFVEWSALYVIGLRQLITYINPCGLTVYLIWYFIRGGEETPPKKDRLSGIDISFLLVLLAAVYLCAYCLNFNMQRAIDIYSVDCTWQIGNINQLASDFPFNDIRVDGIKARYHFFSTMFMAIAKYIFGGEGWVYFAQYQIWYIPFIITISFWKLYGRVIQNKYFAAIMSIATMAGFTFNSGIWNYHMFSNVNSVGLGVSCLILLFLNLKKAESFFSVKCKPEKKHLLWVVQQSLLLFVLSGVKGPIALLYVLAICVWSVFQYLKGRAQGGGLLAFSLVNVFVFAVMYRFLFVAGTQGYFSDWGMDSALLSVLDSQEILYLFEKLGVSGVKGRVIFLLPSLVAKFTILLPFGVLVIVDLFKFLFLKADMRGDLVFSCIIAGGGLCAYYLFHTPDNVQLYFLFSAMPFIAYLCFDKAFALIKTNKWGYIFCAVTSAFVIFNMNKIQMTVRFPERMANFLKESYPETEPQRALTFEAYDFLREHTDKNAVTATNYYGGGTFHEISAFGERRCYLEGYEYSVENFGFDKAEERLQEMNRLFDNDWNDEDRYGYCEAVGIDYLVCFKDVADQPLKLSELFEIVFDNDAVSIYGMERKQ